MEKSLYKRRVAQGLCGSCGEEPIAEGSEGQGLLCKEKSRLRAAARREKKRASLICVEEHCDVPVQKAGGRCAKHKASQAQKRKDSAKELIKQGFCRTARSHGPAKKGRTLCQRCIDQLSKTSSEHYRRRKDAGLCSFGNHPPLPGESLCAYHKEQHEDYRVQLKIEVMDAYGGCVCAVPGCDNAELDELDIHHVDGGGNAHRREVGMEGGGYNFHLWLRKQDYPPGYAVLCPTHHRRADNKLKRRRKKGGVA